MGSAIKKAVSVQEVVKTIANFYGVEENSIYEKTRRKEVVRPRQVIMFLLREDFRISFPTIGEKLGGRDHTTVIHSCEKIKNDLRSDSILNRRTAPNPPHVEMMGRSGTTSWVLV